MLLKKGVVSTWVFSVKVSYDTNYTAPVIDFGVKFSSEPQKDREV